MAENERIVAGPKDTPPTGQHRGFGLARTARWFSQVAGGVIAVGMIAAAAVAGGGPTIPGDTVSGGESDDQPRAEAADTARPALPTFATGDLPVAKPTPTASSTDGVPAAKGQTVTPPVATAVVGSMPAVSPSAAISQPVSPEPASPQPGTPPTVSAPPVAAPATVGAEDDGGGTPGLKPAKVLFGGAKTPAPLAARAIGSYAKGCLSGAKALPVDGPDWQAMRLSRNRNWGHPRLIAMVQRLAKDGREKDGWPGLLVGDISQPRGGPMLTGHASHQIGLDADIWLTPMPDRRLSNEERETLSATSMLADDAVTVAREKWSDGHLNILKRAASYPEVERVLVHPAIKQVLCFAATGDRSWLAKVRPYWGHHYHFHVRMACPPGSEGCVAQAPPPGDDGCGKELDDWIKRVGNAAAPQPIPVPSAKPVKEKPPITLDQLPDACRVVLATGNPEAKADIAAAASAAARIAAEKAAAEKAARNKPASGSKGLVAKSSAGTSTVTKANAKAIDIPLPPPEVAAAVPPAAANHNPDAPPRE